MLSFLLVIALVAILIHFFIKEDSNAGANDATLAEKNREWLNYISSFRAVIKSKSEKHLLEALLEGKLAKDLYEDTPHMAQSASEQVLEVERRSQVQASAVSQNASVTPVEPIDEPKSAPIDNTILLLYFGAFLLVASVGLFLAVGGLSGLAKTIIVGITAAVLYLGGMWLYQNNEKLTQAGMSFVGTGMIIAPLTGVAWYNLVANHHHGGPVWLITSVACIALYVHAISRIKNDFIAYLLIGSFVSTIESTFLVIESPTYVYAWGLIIVGLALLVMGRLKNSDQYLKSPRDTSAQLIVPLSIAGSIYMLPNFGSLQLSITLVMAGVYYVLLALWQAELRSFYSGASQVAFIAAISSIAYYVEPSFRVLAITLLVISALYSLLVAVSSKHKITQHSLLYIAIGTNIAGSVLALPYAWVFVSGLALAVILLCIIWIKLKYDEALQVAGLILIMLPYIATIYALRLDASNPVQLYLSAGSAALLFGITLLSIRHKPQTSSYQTSSVLFLGSAASMMVPAWLNGFGVMLLSAGLLMVAFYFLRRLADDVNWLLCMGVVSLMPIAHTYVNYGINDSRFAIAVGIGLFANITLSFVSRNSIIRWMAVGCILLAPLALFGGGLGFDAGLTGYATGYLLAMASCILARAIARGKLLFSSKALISSYYTEASQAYAAGYAFSACAAVAVSLFATNSQILTTGVLMVILGAIHVIAKVEKNNQVYAFVPVLVQTILFSAVRPDLQNASLVGVVAVSSTLLAGMVYSVTYLFKDKDSDDISVRLIALLTAFVGPALALSQPHPSLLMPVSLFIAGIITYDYNRLKTQQNKELSLAVCIAAIHWFIFLLGYTNIHVHTHILAVFLAGFAVWRNYRGETLVSLNYIQAMFFVVTVPLGLQSLSRENGSTYGLLLIAEQVGFLIAGSLLSIKFLIKAGLWTGLAVILYQLRGLGWAFLSLLAIIVICVAVYRLQKHPPKG